MAGQPGFFDLSDGYEALSTAGDPLERLSAVLDFELFRGPLVASLRRGPRNKGGRPPFDPVQMFKILVLQALYSLSDEASEFTFGGLRLRSRTASRSSAFSASGWKASFPMPPRSGCSANGL